MCSTCSKSIYSLSGASLWSSGVCVWGIGRMNDWMGFGEDTALKTKAYNCKKNIPAPTPQTRKVWPPSFHRLFCFQVLLLCLLVHLPGLLLSWDSLGAHSTPTGKLCTWPCPTSLQLNGLGNWFLFFFSSLKEETNSQIFKTENEQTLTRTYTET